MTDTFHVEADRLARRIEVAIEANKAFLDELPDFEEGRDRRAKKLQQFCQRFGL